MLYTLFLWIYISFSLNGIRFAIRRRTPDLNHGAKASKEAPPFLAL